MKDADSDSMKEAIRGGPAQDAIGVAMRNLRRGGKELLRAQRLAGDNAGAASRRLPGGIPTDDPGYRAFLTAEALSQHIAQEQEEREQAVTEAIASDAARRGRCMGAAWRPTAFLAECQTWMQTGAAWVHSGQPLPSRIGPFSLMSPDEIRAALISTSSYPEPQWRQPGFEPYPGPQLGLVESITWTPTEFEDPSYMLEAGMTNPATETAEGDAAPEASFNYVPTTTYVKRLPVVLPASRQALDDVAVLEALLTGRLLFMIKVRLLGQIIAGNGSLGAMAGNLCGIINTPGVLPVLKATSGSPLQPQVDAIAAAIAAIRVATLSWYEPDSLVIHPNDAEELAQAKDTAGRFIFPPDKPLSPFGLTTTVTSSACAGMPLVGAAAALQGFVRGDVFLAISDSHLDYFTRRLVSLYAEMRVGFAVRQPLAWCQIANFDA